jgi:hypothetical protein
LLCRIYKNEVGVKLKDGRVSNLGERDYIIKAPAGESNVSGVLISRVIGKPAVMFAAPIIIKPIDAIRSVVRHAHETTEQVRTGSDEIQTDIMERR